MLLKIFKTEFKKLLMTLWPLYIAEIGIALLIGITTQLTKAFGGDGSPAVIITGAGMTMVGIIAIGLIPTAITFMIYYRFYKAISTDEGYLTFSVPATTAQQLGSRFLVVLCVELISTAVGFSSIFVGVSISVGIAQFYSVMGNLFRQIIELLNLIELNVVVQIVELVIMGIVGTVMSISQTMFAIILGHRIAKKYKAGATIGAIVLMGYVEGIIFELLTIPITITSISSTANPEVIAHLFFFIITFAMLVITFLCVWFGYKFIDKKLNLD